MPANKKLKAEELVSFDLAAAGHDGVLSDPSGSLVIKPCTAREVAFYESAAARPEFAKWMPLFFGTLQLNDPSAADEAPAHARNTSIVLQNLTKGFTKPCVLDIKLGAQLWDQYASEEKRARLDKVSDETTSRSMGMRVAGMKVWKGEERGGYKVYDKIYGRTFTADNVIETLREYFDSEISPEHIKLLAKRFAEDVAEIQEVLEGQESRMYSASLLFVYEGDGKALEEALAEEASRAAREKKEEEEDDDDEDEDEAEEKKSLELKLIDFAHADWTPGQGPDENALQGVRSVRSLLEQLS